jgi:mono/diheme cytochrome c family protein
VTSEGGFLAFADADRLARGESAFAPIDRRQVDPGPAYVVWQGEGRSDAHRYPWPYQLVAIELVDLAERFPHAVPPTDADADARTGWEIFSRECISCHAVNGDGGRVGPELNVPRSIVEYRPAEQIRAYVRNPQAFRYTTMPAHLHFSEADLDALLAYLRLMSRYQHDPGAPSEEP